MTFLEALMKCRVCGCTDLNCAECIERTGKPWRYTVLTQMCRCKLEGWTPTAANINALPTSRFTSPLGSPKKKTVKLTTKGIGARQLAYTRIYVPGKWRIKAKRR